MQLYGLNGLSETIAALKVEAAGYRSQALKIAGTLSSIKMLSPGVFVEEYGWAAESRADFNYNEKRKQTINLASEQKARKIRAEALLLEQRAAVIEGSIISLTLQAQANAATKPVPAPVTVPPKPIPIVTAPSKPARDPVVVSPVPIQVRVTAPSSVTKASMPQIPEAPLPVALPPISRIQPVQSDTPYPSLAPVPPPVTPEQLAPAGDIKKLLPWILAAGAAFLF